MPMNDRLKRLESLMKQKSNNNHSQELNLSEEEMRTAYKDASSSIERLYIKKGTEYLAINDLNSSQFQQNYRDLIDGRIKLFSESELEQME